jgi:phytoene dehydrogenase-like protein
VDDVKDRYVDVLVVGAGIAGLTAAAKAAKAGRSVAVLDVRSAGGRARSDERDGYVLNQGPRALYRSGPGSAVLASLGLDLPGGSPASEVFGWRSGRFDRLPTSTSSLVSSRLLGWRAKLKLAKLLATFGRLDAAALAPLSAAGWVRSLKLPDDGSEVLTTLLRVATYAPDLEAISADAAVRQLQLVQAGGVSYLHGGWSRLVEGLAGAAREAGAVITEGERVTGPLGRAEAASWRVPSERGTWTAGAVVVAVGGPAAARALLPIEANWELGEDATAACLDLGLKQPPKRRVAFGLDEPLYFSTHSPTAELAPPGAAMVHVMRYGARSSDEDRRQLREFAEAAGVRKDDVVVERFLHKMVVSHSLPRPGAGLAGRPPVSVAGAPGVFVAGDWVGPVGLLADASLSSGSEAGKLAAAAAEASPDDAGASRALAGPPTVLPPAGTLGRRPGTDGTLGHAAQRLVG